MSEVPDTLRLAEMYDFGDPAAHGNAWKSAVCTELRRLHDRVQELESIERQLCEQADVAANAYRELQSEAANNARIIGASAETELALRGRIAEMEKQMAAIGAGGVEPLRKRAAAPQVVQAAVPQIDWESAAEKIAIDVADNCGTVPNLAHPHIYLGLKKLFANL